MTDPQIEELIRRLDVLYSSGRPIPLGKLAELHGWVRMATEKPASKATALVHARECLDELESKMAGASP